MKSDKKLYLLIVLILTLCLGGLVHAQEMPEEMPQETPQEMPEGAGTDDLGTAPAPPGPLIGGEEVPSAEVRTDVEGPLEGEEKVYLNVQDADIKDIIKQISKATGRNFIIDDKVKGKVTIISERPMTREEAYQTFLSALEVAGFTTVKGPANVIKVVSLKDASKSPIPTHVDSTPYTDSFITRLIPLENISALDMSNAIKDLISREGNMFAYPSTNTLIITDSGANIDRLMKIVKELDQEGPQQVMEIIPIRNAMASEIAKMIQDLFEQEKATATRTSRARKGAQLEELEEVSKIIPDERTNSIIVLASKRAIERVRTIIDRLDKRLSAADEGRIHVYYLKHAKAKTLAETLSAITAASSSAGAKGKGVDIAVARFEGGVKITADESTNSLIITALPKDFQTLVEKVISKLDIPRRQVYFEAVVMELQLTKGSEYGVSGYGGATIGGNLIPFGETLGGPNTLSNAMTGGWPALLGGLISSKTTNLTVLGSDGTTSTVTIPAFSAFLSALATRGETNVVATPNLLTLDNEEATMHVLSKEPIPGSTSFAQGVATTPSIDYQEAGLELKIKPQITEGDMVLLEIEQKLANFVQASFSTQLNAPAKKERKVKTVVVTENGQTVVLAGLMDDIHSRTKRKIPLLGDIPLLGFLFSTTTNSLSKSNLLIFITPHIIKDRTDFSAILKKKIEQNNEFIDSNYSKAKKRQIRSVIKTHREDLLEFKDSTITGTEIKGEGVILSEKAKVLTTVPKQPVITAPQASPAGTQPVIQPQPVITPSAPAAVKGVSSKSEAIPPGAVIESSSWKPIEPPPAYVKPAPAYTPPPVTPPAETVAPKTTSPTAVKKPAPDAYEVPEPVPAPVLPPAPVQPKEYKKPVVPEKILNGNGPDGSSSTTSSKSAVPWVPSSKTTDEAKKVEEVKKPSPVITVPEEVEEEEKVWQKPSPRSRNGEIDLAY